MFVTTIDVNDFTEEKECIYDGERYSVRDNGAVLRHSRPDGRKRANDNCWTFGESNSSNAYLHIAGVRVHRIVATAFHGDPPDPKYVVDHLDSNQRNNRPENLKWVTRLENTLNNPLTRRKIEYLCGSIEAFLENPRMLDDMKLEPNLSWMRTVTPEEARNCKDRINIWLQSNKKSSGGALGEWIYKPINNSTVMEITQTEPDVPCEAKPEKKQFVVSKPIKSVETVRAELREELRNRSAIAHAVNYPELVQSLTPRCVQRKWRVPTTFPNCPLELGSNPIESYFQKLKVGETFAYNDKYPGSKICDFVKIKDNTSILVKVQSAGLKPWALAEVTFENDLYVHTSLGSYFQEDGADKYFCLEQGLEWTGGQTYDDLC